MATRPLLLYLSSIVPDVKGSGLAMRTGLHVEALSRLFDVHLTVVHDGMPEPLRRVPDSIARFCARVSFVELGSRTVRSIQGVRNEQLRLLAEAVYPLPLSYGHFFARPGSIDTAFLAEAYDATQVCRMRLAPLALALGRRNVRLGKLVLDLDDFESKAASRSAGTMRSELGFQHYVLKRLEAMKLAALERWLLPRFDHVLVCSETDKHELERQYRHSGVEVMPNVVRAPEDMGAQADKAPVFTFLFVGALNYYPNVDGLLYFANEVLPALRKLAPAPFRIAIIGRKPPNDILKLSRHPEIEVHADVPDVAPFYRRAHVAIAPIRVGGGTRIKILEAFSYRVPVVSTVIGAEGLEARAGAEILIADDGPGFAAHCAGLMQDRTLRERIAAAGQGVFADRYSFAAAAAKFATLYDMAERRRAAA